MVVLFVLCAIEKSSPPCLVFLQGAGGTSGLAQLSDEEAKVSGVLLGVPYARAGCPCL